MTQVRESETSRGESSKCRRNSMMDAAMTYAVVNEKYVYNLASLFFQATRSRRLIFCRVPLIFVPSLPFFPSVCVFQKPLQT